MNKRSNGTTGTTNRQINSYRCNQQLTNYCQSFVEPYTTPLANQDGWPEKDPKRWYNTRPCLLSFCHSFHYSSRNPRTRNPKNSGEEDAAQHARKTSLRLSRSRSSGRKNRRTAGFIVYTFL